MNNTNKEKNTITHPPSDGSELIPAEVQAKTGEGTSKPLNEPMGAGYRVDEEGIVNNYALEPEMSKAEYPSQKQQRRYIFLGVIAVLFITSVVWIAFRVS